MYANILLEQLTVESDVSLTVRVLRVRVRGGCHRKPSIEKLREAGISL